MNDLLPNMTTFHLNHPLVYFVDVVVVIVVATIVVGGLVVFFPFVSMDNAFIIQWCIPHTQMSLKCSTPLKCMPSKWMD